MKKTLKKMLCGVCSAAMLMGAVTFSASAAAAFTDVKPTDYFAKPVEWAVQNGITAGVSDTQFGPNQSCTRAQAMTFLWAAADRPEPAASANFSDVKSTDYFAKAVAWAVENGITAGVGGGKFGANQPCTRGQIMTFLWRFGGSEEIQGGASFSDVSSSDYFAKPVAWAVKNEVTAGIGGGKFGPNQTCTRGQIMTMLWRADQIDAPVVPEPEKPTEPAPTEPKPTEPAHTHSYTSVITKEATYTKEGERTYTCSVCGDSYTEVIPVIYSAYPEVDEFFYNQHYRTYDETLTPPETRWEYSKISNRAFIVASIDPKDIGSEYQVVLAKDANFTVGLLFDNSVLITEHHLDEDSEMVFSHFEDFGFNSQNNEISGKYYYMVRTIKWEMGSYVYGPWSEIGVISCIDFSNRLENQAARYSYELYFVDDLGTDVYTTTGRAIYIKTDNPDLTSIRLTLDGEIVTSYAGNYEDVEFLNPDDTEERMRAVEGGYLCDLNIHETRYSDGTSLIDKSGNYTFELWEASVDGYVVAKEFQLNVLLLQEEYTKWKNDVINTQTNDRMNPVEKMDAIVQYLTNGHIRYFTTDGTRYLTLAAEPNYPELQTKRWNSFISPNRLYSFASLIGGFDEIHNCYGDYAYGTAEWLASHYYIYVVYEGEKYYFEACPDRSTGYIETIEMIDFSNTSQFTRIV